MLNIHFSGSTNNYKPKIKSNINSTTPNTKLNQNQNKIRKIHKSPINALNKSQNISITKNVFKTNINNFTNNNPIYINSKKIYPLKNLHFFHKNKNLKLDPFLYNANNNRSISKNNSLSHYFKTCTKINHGLKRNHTNKNLINITNDNTSNFNEYLKNNIYYHTKVNINNLKKNSKNIEKSPLIKIKNYLPSEDLTLSKNINLNNINSSLYPLVITEESKKNNNENIQRVTVKKSESLSNTYIKNNYSSIKKLKSSSTTMLSKSNIILNNNKQNNQNKSKINNILERNQTSPQEELIESLSNEKNKGHMNFDTLEFKIIKDLKELKNCKNNEVIDKIKVIFEKAIEYLVPKESQNIFSLIIKEIIMINKEFYDNNTHLKLINDSLKTKLNNYDKKYKELMDKLKLKEKELIILKKEVENYDKEKKKLENIENKIFVGKNSDIAKKSKKNVSSVDVKMKRNNNTFIKKLNAKNIDDLDALYFFDKINYNQNDVEKDIPKLNLEQKYIEKCIKKEIIKRNEINLTPFQKIALQFEMIST